MFDKHHYSLFENDKERIVGVVSRNDDTIQFKPPGGIIFSRDGFIFGAAFDTTCNKINFEDVKQVRLKKFDVLKTAAIWAALIGISILTMDISDFSLGDNCQAN